MNVVRATVFASAFLVLCSGCEDRPIYLDPPPQQQQPRPDCPDGRCPYEAVPPVDLPEALREWNYAGGSCVHASMVTVLRNQGMIDLAAWWRRSYAYGETFTGFVRKSEAAGLRYAYTFMGDAAFLDWCSRTRRGAVIFYKPAHAITFAGYVDGNAVLIDNNHPHRPEYVERGRFLQLWRGYGGMALTPVHSPNPPRPWI